MRQTQKHKTRTRTGTIRNADPDLDAGSVVQCRTRFAHFDCTRGKPDVWIQTFGPRDANPDPDLRIQTRQKFIKMSGSGSRQDPDPRIGLKVMQIGTDPDSGIQIQEFFMRTPDSHRIRTVWYGSPPPDPVGLQTIFMCERYLNLRHLVDPKYRNPEFSWIMVFLRGSGSQNTTIYYGSVGICTYFIDLW